MLEANGVAFRYREYSEERLDASEIRRVLEMLELGPRDVLRASDGAATEAGLSGDEDDERLIELMAAYPTLLQRPIGVAGGRAVLGRPPERLLDLVDS